MLFANSCYKIAETCINDSHPYSLDWALDYVGCAPKLGYVANCAIYSAPKVCFACKEGFSGSNSSCSPFTPNPLITNCEFYSKNTCALCEEGFQYDPDSNTCVAPTDANCVVYDFVLNECARCNYGYSVDPDTGLCVTTVDANCNEFSSSQTCLCCKVGYSLVNGVC